MEDAAWPVDYTDEFEGWWTTLGEAGQIAVAAHVGELERRGPNLPFPYSSKVVGSRHGNMRELRIQQGGRPLRVFYALDPKRRAILLLGGDKTGDARFYERCVPIADEIYDRHLAEIAGEEP
ncbi:MAG TPA: type II toxin-antitoxin system RelE/ParE family toxin [Terriglobales bacterium]|nr:type II toxin-antitoxin system RelE/ParE family toxin [Terriglobales bacterium]